jgi:hypothetical protein
MKKTKQFKGLTWLNFGIFYGGIVFCHGLSNEEILADLTKVKATEWKDAFNYANKSKEFSNWCASTTTCTIKGKEKVFSFIVIKEQFDFSDEHYAKLAHEVLHICQFTLPDYLNRDREYECEAYLHTHIMTQCLKAIRGIK